MSATPSSRRPRPQEHPLASQPHGDQDLVALLVSKVIIICIKLMRVMHMPRSCSDVRNARAECCGGNEPSVKSAFCCLSKL